MRRSAEEEENPHAQGFCAFCHEFCFHGSCEHFHAACVDLNQISLREPTFPQRQKTTPLFEQRPVEVIFPAASRSFPASSQASHPPKHPLAGCHTNAALTDFLRADGWALWASVLQQERFSIDLLATLAVSDLRAAAPSIPAGILVQMQAAVQRQKTVGAPGRISLPMWNSWHPC